MTPATPSRTTPLRKGEETRAIILDAALRQASRSGFEALTIGPLAEVTGLSKSGLFAHFGSKEELQIATVEEAVRRFTEIVFVPATKHARGLPRLRALFENWLVWADRAELPGSCPIQTASVEFDDRPGPVRDALVKQQRRLGVELARAVQMTIDSGEFAADSDPDQFAFEMTGILLVFYQARRLIGEHIAAQRARTAFESRITAFSSAAVVRHDKRPPSRKTT
jgi:AcrR family transcriptional regulator